MKKILTLLMMFLVCGNLLFAQSEGTTSGEGTTAAVTVQPKLNFQAVVRDGNNQLVYSTDVSTVITVTYNDGTYTETHPSVTTNENGLLNLVIGEGEDVDGDLNDVDWSSATIKADITYTAPVVKEDGTTESQDLTISVETPITAVPYALQAGSARLTTDMIVNYISGIQLGTNGTPDQKRDVLLILDAIRLNEHGLKNALKDTIVEYMKTRMDIAKEIFHYYLDHVDSADVWQTYNTLMANPTAKEQVRKVIIDFIKSHKNDAIEVLEYYAEHVTTADLQDLFNEFDHNELLKNAVRAIVATELEGYLSTNGYISANGCPEVDICALANAGKPCPTSNDFIGTTNNVSGILQTTITNPNALALTATYDVTYTTSDGTVSVQFGGSKDGENLIKASELIPETATNVSGTITVHVYGCDTDFTKTF